MDLTGLQLLAAGGDVGSLALVFFLTKQGGAIKALQSDMELMRQWLLKKV